MLELIIIVLLVFIGVQEFLNRKERKNLVETIIAKNLQELGDLESKRSFKPKEEKPPEFVPVSELEDDKFDDYIKKVNEEE